MFVKQLKSVETFMLAGKQTVSEKLDFQDKKARDFRISLIEEELKETMAAIDKKSEVDIVDGICDSLYVLYGTMLSFGIKYFDDHTYKLSDDEMEFEHLTIKELVHATLNEKITIVKKSEEKTVKSMLQQNEIMLNYLKIHLSLLDLETVNEHLYSKVTRGVEHALVLSVLNLFELAEFMKFPVDKAFEIVHNSNMSKFCTSETEAKESVAVYEKSGRKTTYEKIDIFKTSIYTVKDAETGKILKSHVWKKPEPELEKLLKLN